MTPVVTSSTANLADSSTTITIKGSGFSTTTASNTISFNDGAVGQVERNDNHPDGDLLDRSHHRRQPYRRGDDELRQQRVGSSRSPR